MADFDESIEFIDPDDDTQNPLSNNKKSYHEKISTEEIEELEQEINDNPIDVRVDTYISEDLKNVYEKGNLRKVEEFASRKLGKLINLLDDDGEGEYEYDNDNDDEVKALDSNDDDYDSDKENRRKEKQEKIDRYLLKSNDIQGRFTRAKRKRITEAIRRCDEEASFEGNSFYGASDGKVWGSSRKRKKIV